MAHGVTLSGETRHTLADEHDALRRVATLVASGATPEKVFGAVTQEVGRVLPVDFADLSRYESDGTITILATWGITQAVLPPGARPSLGGKNLSTLVAESGASARIEDYADASGPIGAAVRGAGVRSVVGTPIIVDGHLWGMVAAGSRTDKPLPADAEARLASFTELLAVAIANAEGRGELARLAEEQAALRRVATLVARGAPQKEVFAAVIEEVGGLLPVFNASLARYEPDGTVSAVAAWGEAEIGFPVGSRWTPGGKNLITMVLETGRPARMDSYADATGSIATALDEMGVRSAVASPILVQGRLWGVIVAGSNLEQPLAPDTEARLASFTELVATAIANAESRAGLTNLAEEQTALRRVAVLVTRGMAQADLFTAVTEELGRLLAVDFVIMGRYEDDGTVTSVGGWGAAAARFPVGSRSKLEGENLVTIVLESGRPARVDDFARASGPIGVAGRKSGFHSAIGAPIVVDGRTWGVMTVGSVLPRPRLAAGTETRLESFTELVATAIANAESRARLGRLAAEQATLRRVATLVAQGVAPEEVFAAVADEVVQLLAVDFAHMGRYEGDGTVTVVASSGRTAETFRVGRRWNLGGRNLTTIVFETGRSARLDRYSDAFGALGTAGRELGIRSAVGAPIVVEDNVWGVVTAGSTVEDTLPADLESRLENFTELAATAIANAQTRAELAASRARIVAATDESRRRIERDLHDGAQQRLVHAVIVLKLALRELADGGANARELVAEALGHAEQANSELRELAHGILPAALTRGGLRAGVEALLSRISLPVNTNVTPERLPPSVEATAYFIISEALTNVVKHAHATRAEVTARLERGELRLEIRDDGVGGAKGSHDTGLGGLRDRVSALDGRLGVVSPPDGGTSLLAQLPVTTLTQASSGQ